MYPLPPVQISIYATGRVLSKCVVNPVLQITTRVRSLLICWHFALNVVSERLVISLCLHQLSVNGN